MKTERVEIGINRIVGINCLFVKYFAILNGLHHERSIKLRHPNRGGYSKTYKKSYSVGLI
jgi:hypothetical protein